jgi:hypothetical protein
MCPWIPAPTFIKRFAFGLKGRFCQSAQAEGLGKMGDEGWGKDSARLALKQFAQRRQLLFARRLRGKGVERDRVLEDGL